MRKQRAAVKPAMHAAAVRRVIAIWIKDEGRSGRD